MARFFRRLIAAQIAKATSWQEERILPLIFPLPTSKKRLVIEYSVPVKELYEENLPPSVGRGSASDGLQDFASSIASKIVCPAHIHHVRVGKAGMLYFEVSASMMVNKVLEQVGLEGDQYGVTLDPWQSRRQERIIVEYSSPNIAKPFHAGHLRSTLIGNCIANLHAAMGHHVTRLNYLGDWGVQFGLLGVGFQRFGSEAELSGNAIQHLFDVYVRANKEAQTDPSIRQDAQTFAQALEKGDPSCLDVWRRFRDLSIKEYSATYQRLGVTFDVYAGESEYSEKAHNLLALLRDRNLLRKTEQGTSVVDLSEQSLPQSRYALLMKSDGTSLYLTRDLAAALDRHQTHGFDRMYYVVDKSQTDHFVQLREVLRKMNVDWADRLHHISFGRVLGMKTRTGHVVLLRDILAEAQSRMLRNMQQTASSKELSDPEAVAEVLGVSAMIVRDLKGRLRNDYQFNWDRILTSQGDTGVFMQYTHARLYSMERLCGVDLDPSCDTSCLTEPAAVFLAQHLSLYNSAITQAQSTMEPSNMVAYLLQLCHSVSSAVKVLRVKDAPREQAKARLLLFSCARIALANGMRVLGIKPVNQM